ncbi:AbrB/MazE/SpoVT family DNA-binding domain-containing protein [Geothrix fuzhouensis]|uniref:AbrB/MazE/SpoVT family DNA-binding domain-containing protein n=1 Tax=Geothrix fuzhouensis TaxID=2966451 RepID=UPI002148AAAD|nr:AbrB/MazE/SpoVT family DNA-binding domain-containing protein [Geothrix fuzhouensis]
MILVKARKQGGAVIITIPAGLLKLLDIKAGDALDLDVLPDGFVIRKAEPAHRRYKLAEMLEGVIQETIKEFNAQVAPAMTAEIVARTIRVVYPAKG